MAITDFHLLLLEGDPGRRESMLQAAREAGLARVHALSDVAEARNFLDERIPSLLLFDLDAPSGLEILSVVKRRPELRRIVTVGLFDRRDGEALGAAYDLHINSCLVRPNGSEEQVGLFRSLRQYWEGMNQTSGF
jgi:DNA-binding response OmpR family regulator